MRSASIPGELGHPHDHVTVRAVGADGRRLTAGPKELQAWRERFARELRRSGIEAEATPRQARGLVRRADGMAVHKIERRGDVPWVRKAAIRQAEREAAAPETRERQEWQAAIERRQNGIRRAYLAHAAVLSASADPANRQLGSDVERFVADLPVAATRRQAVAAELRAVTNEHLEKADIRAVSPPSLPASESPSPR